MPHPRVLTPSARLMRRFLRNYRERHIQKYKWGRRGTTAAPNKRRQLRGNGGADDLNAFNASSMTTFPVLSPQDGQQNSFLRLKAVYFGHVYQGNFPLPAPPPWPLAPDAA